MLQATETTSLAAALLPPPPLDGASGGGLSPAVVSAALDKILSSSTFIRSKRLGRFLRFTVEQCLQGRQSALKEYLVGVEVFNKLETFDPRIDSIVRVEARRLRSKLEKYYQTEGRDDHLVVQFHKGSYVPQILTREQVTAEALVSASHQGGRKSIAVSSFANLSIDPAHAHFCSGLTQDIISALIKVPTLRVIARTTKGGEASADYVIEGSLRKQNERLRIAAQLIDTANDTYIWSETYEVDLADAFAVQDEISKSIVAALRRESK